MKRNLTLIISLVMLVVSLFSCGDKHSHEDDPWTATVEGHYQICGKSGKKMNEGGHDLNNDNVCKLCGAALHADGPGVLEITSYNKHGLRESYVEYRMGKETYRRVYEYAYQDGEPVSYKAYVGTEIYEEGVVVKIDEEYQRLRTRRNYDEYYQLRTYNEDGFVTSITDYDKKGDVLNAEKYIYEKDSNGTLLSGTCYESDKKVELEKYALDENGALYVCEYVRYNSNGEVSYITKYDSEGYVQEYIRYENGEIDYVEKNEYVFDKNGELLSQKTFTNDVLRYEKNYKYADYEYAYPKTQLYEYIYYMSYDGKYIDSYDDYGDIVLSKQINPDGETTSEVKIEYTRDELVRVTLEKEFEGDFLSEETAYEYEGTSDDWSKRTKIEYDEDGGKEITVYNDNYDKISYIEYDENGEIVTNETYEYEYNENGDAVIEKTYSDGSLIGEVRNSYDEDGNRTFEEIFENGVLVETWEYLLGQYGGTYSAITTWYLSNGGKRVITYAENGSITLDIQYDADGNYDHYFKYTTVKNDDGGETTYTHDENGEPLHEIRRDAYGNRVEWVEYYSYGKEVRFYDENGDLTRSCEYDKDGKLVSEIVYGDDSSVVTETQYYDGGKTVYTHNSDGTVTCEVFDSNGNLIESETI